MNGIVFLAVALLALLIVSGAIVLIYNRLVRGRIGGGGFSGGGGGDGGGW